MKKRAEKEKKANEADSSTSESETDIEIEKNKKKSGERQNDNNMKKKKNKVEKKKVEDESKENLESSGSDVEEKERKEKKNLKKKKNKGDKQDMQHQQKPKVADREKEPEKEENKKDTNEDGKDKNKDNKKENALDNVKRGLKLTEKERTKDVEEFAGSSDKKKNDRVKDESILDETGNKVIDESDKMLTVKDLVEMMSIMMVSQRRLGNPNMVNIGDVANIDISIPTICDEIEPEFDLKYDTLAKWCVFQGKIRTIEPFIDYETFIRNYIAMLHETVLEFYRYFRISDRVNLQSVRIIPPEIVGSYAKWNEIQKSDVIQNYYNNIELFRPHKLNNGYMHRIFLNPCLQAFCDETQRFLCQGDPGYEIRLW